MAMAASSARRIVLVATGKSKAVHRARGQRPDHHQAARVVPAAAPDAELMPTMAAAPPHVTTDRVASVLDSMESSLRLAATIGGCSQRRIQEQNPEYEHGAPATESIGSTGGSPETPSRCRSWHHVQERPKVVMTKRLHRYLLWNV